MAPPSFRALVSLDIPADFAKKTEVQAFSYNFGVDTGTAGAYAVALVPAIVAYFNGLRVSFLAVNANAGASTLAVNGLAVKNIKKWVGGALVNLAAADISAGQYVLAIYDGTQFQYKP